MLIPYEVDVPMSRWPISNFLLIPAIMAFSVFAWIGLPEDVIEKLVLAGWDPMGMLGHMFLHGGVMHLLGNMLFLWVFGNAVCAKVGNLSYVAVFFGLGLLAAATHNLMDGDPAIGASGAINGIVGFFLVLYPLNNISCIWVWGGGGTLSVSSMWIIFLFLAFDIWGTVTGSSGVAYWAHLGGFAAGAGAAVVALKLGIITMTRTEKSLLEVWAERQAV